MTNKSEPEIPEKCTFCSNKFMNVNLTNQNGVNVHTWYHPDNEIPVDNWYYWDHGITWPRYSPKNSPKNSPESSEVKHNEITTSNSEKEFDIVMSHESTRMSLFKSKPFAQDYNECIRTKNWLSIWNNTSSYKFVIRCMDEKSDLKSRRSNFLAIENEINHILKSIRTNAKMIHLGFKNYGETSNYQPTLLMIFVCETLEAKLADVNLPLRGQGEIARPTPTCYYVLLVRCKTPESNFHFFMSYSKNITRFWLQPVPPSIYRAIRQDNDKMLLDLIQLVCSIDKIYDKQFPMELIRLLIHSYRNATLYFAVDSHIKSIINPINTVESSIKQKSWLDSCLIM